MNRSAIGWRCALFALVAVTAQAQTPTLRWVEFETMVNPVTILRISQAIDDAELAGDEALIIRMDTPGGLSESMQSAVQRILASKVPVVVWVGPAGGRAASAGFFLLQAADVAAMATGTRTGAASTVVLGGENREGDLVLKKANEDAAALIRSIVAQRGRNVEAAEQTIFESRAFDERAALENGLIDLIADSRGDLLAKLDGREVRRFDGSTRRLRTAEAQIVESEFSIRHRFIEGLSHPTIAFFLLLGGIVGLWVELTHPGVVLPGVVGALCLLLFALAAQTLEISIIGLLLVVLAVVMFILEIKVVSYGMLTFGGLISLILGTWMMFDGPIPEMRIPLPVIIPSAIVAVGTIACFVYLAAQAQRSAVTTGREGLTGEFGHSLTDLLPEGTVFVHGEQWLAASISGPLPAGTRVRVRSLDGLKLIVEPAAEGPEERGER